MMLLNKEQEKAVRHTKGPALVLAGPGSGKTAVITERTVRLIEQEGVPAEQILVVTFSRKAAGEMERRFFRMFQGKGRPTFGTFHSVFFRILKQVYQIDNQSLLLEKEKLHRMDAVCGKVLSDYEASEEFLLGLLREVSLVKSGAVRIENYMSVCVKPTEFRRIFYLYQKGLRASQKIDFDDMVLLCLRLLKERPDILRFWQKQFRYILVDEFQDISPLQYETVRLLAAPAHNLFVVGDDDQSIYAFRGAKPDLMRTFAKDYPKAARITLRLNYRSAPEIVEAAQKVIRNNRNRFSKQIESARGELQSRVRIFACPDPYSEYHALAKDIKAMLEARTPMKEIAVLLRNTKDARLLLRVLEQYQIPIKESNRKVLEQKGALEKDAMQVNDAVQVKDAVQEKDAMREKAASKLSTEEKRGIHVMTMHAAKGLEFDHVFLPDLNEGVIPGAQHFKKDQIEEERRIFYVALTRAARTLSLYYCTKRSQTEARPSRFVTELLD